MDEPRRGITLTIFAILFALLAISNLLKPFHIGGAETGFVFLGTRTTGVANAILGPLFGLVLLAYAAGIWRMKRYAMPLAYAYAGYVVLNLSLFSIRNPPPKHAGEMVFGIVYIAIAVGVSLASALALTRRRGELT